MNLTKTCQEHIQVTSSDKLKRKSRNYLDNHLYLKYFNIYMFKLLNKIISSKKMKPIFLIKNN